jgi:hypothetical protein
MRNKVLYFPYINVPKSNWLTRMLLYWDSVGAIVPYDFIENPSLLDAYTRDLVEKELVIQVIPGDHLYKIPRFVDAFVDYLLSLGSILDNRITSFRRFPSRRSVRIHIEKMNELERILEDMALAKLKKYPWYDVEIDTANEFMTYLAAALGQLHDLHYMPVTDELRHLKNLAYSQSSDLIPENKVSDLRLELLGDLFPAPDRPLNPAEIANFKNKHGNLLSQFRNYVEIELVKLADIQDNELRTRGIQLFKSKAKEEVTTIIDHFHNSGYKRLTLAKLGSIISAIPGASEFVGLASAIYNAFTEPELITLNRDLLYVAYAQKELLANNKV